MKKTVSLDGSLTETGEAMLSAASAAVLYGRGVFTTVAVRNGEPLNWEKHERRLARDAARVGLGAEISDIYRAEVSLRELLDADGLREGKARVSLLDASVPARWGGSPLTGVAVLVQLNTVAPMPPPRLTFSPYPVNEASPLTGVKSCNYLEALLAFDEARKRGFDEAVRINASGIVTSGCLSSIFWKSRATGRLHTPGLATGCLAGTTRELLIETVGAEEVEAGLEEFRSDAACVYLTSAARGVAAAHSLEGMEGFDPPESGITSVA